MVKDMLALPEWHDIPILNGIVEAPTFSHEGTLLRRPGYDAAGRLWFHAGPGLTIPAVPEQPSPEHVGEARGLLLDELLGDFLSLPLNPSRCSEDWLRPFVLGSEGHPAWTQRVPCGVSDARRRKTEANRTDRPTGDFSVAGTPRSRKDLTPPGVCSDDGGRRPWASRRSCLGRGAPSVSAPGSPSPVRGGSGHGGSRQGSRAAGDAGGSR